MNHLQRFVHRLTSLLHIPMRIATTGLALVAAGSGLSPVHADSPPVLIQGAYVMTMDPALGDLPDADILVQDGRIQAIGPALSAPQARRIDARGTIVMPGFVDVHSHLWITTMRGQFRNEQGAFFPTSSRLGKVMTPEDVRLAMLLGVLEQVDSGITTTADFFDNVVTPAHAEAGLQALQQGGTRATLFYGGPDKSGATSIDLAHLEALAARSRVDDRVQLGLAWRLPRQLDDQANWALRQREYDTARRLGLPIQVHVSGNPHPMFDALVTRGALYPGLTVVHATDARPDHLAALQRAGAALALTPVSEHRVGFGLTRLDHFGTVSRQGFGLDGNALAGSADMFATLRLAALTWSGGARNEKAPSPRDLLVMATRGGSEVLGLADQIGTLTPGKRADLQIIGLDAINLAGFGGGDPAALLVYSARPSDVRTVMVEGRVLKQDGALTHPDLAGVLRQAQDSAQGMLQRAPAP